MLIPLVVTKLCTGQEKQTDKRTDKERKKERKKEIYAKPNSKS
jgi:hypothetical protein